MREPFDRTEGSEAVSRIWSEGAVGACFERSILIGGLRCGEQIEKIGVD
jgi:hypothetical protein